MSLHLSILGRVDIAAPSMPLPLAAGEVRTGFPSPADDYLEAELDLVEHPFQTNENVLENEYIPKQ